MFRLLHQPQEVTDKPGAKPLVVTGGEIKFDNVVFAYDPERIVLKGISFTRARRQDRRGGRPVRRRQIHASRAFSIASTTSNRVA